jgi:hypothetical protein
MCLANIFGDPIAQIDRIIESLHPERGNKMREEGDRRQQDTLEQEMMADIEKTDSEVLKRVACGATDTKDAEYLAARLNRRMP